METVQAALGKILKVVPAHVHAVLHPLIFRSFLFQQADFLVISTNKKHADPPPPALTET